MQEEACLHPFGIDSGCARADSSVLDGMFTETCNCHLLMVTGADAFKFIFVICASPTTRTAQKRTACRLFGLLGLSLLALPDLSTELASAFRVRRGSRAGLDPSGWTRSRGLLCTWDSPFFLALHGRRSALDMSESAKLYNLLLHSRT